MCRMRISDLQCRLAHTRAERLDDTSFIRKSAHRAGSGPPTTDLRLDRATAAGPPHVVPIVQPQGMIRETKRATNRPRRRNGLLPTLDQTPWLTVARDWTLLGAVVQ